MLTQDKESENEDESGEEWAWEQNRVRMRIINGEKN